MGDFRSGEARQRLKPGYFARRILNAWIRRRQTSRSTTDGLDQPSKSRCRAPL